MNMLTDRIEAANESTGSKPGVDVLEAAKSVDTPHLHPIIVVGGGPVGVRTAQELSKAGLHVLLFNAESWKPYNRVQLTPFLAGEAQIGQVYQPERFPGPGTVLTANGVSVASINRENKSITTATGDTVYYSKLVLAIGSSAYTPPISGADRKGVYTFRNLDDIEGLISRSASARRVVIVGGGLLGLEAARGMANRGSHVTVLEHENRLMPRQLDDEAGLLLANRIRALGVDILTGKPLKSVNGMLRIKSVTVTGHGDIPCDTVIFCTGVRANTKLPLDAGLDVVRGVKVNDQMQTSDPDIYAVGECAEHKGLVYGLVGPGFEQAKVAAGSIKGTADATYTGSIPTTKLKVLGADVFSIGDFEPLEGQPDIESILYRDDAKGIYRRLFLDGKKLVAALAIGKWEESSKLQQIVTRGRNLNFIEVYRFRKTGSLWPDMDGGAAHMPKEAIICNCTGVTKGAIIDAMSAGAGTLEEVRVATSANSVCGTCKPLIVDIMGAGNMAPEAAKAWKWLLGLSAVAALIAFITLIAPRIPLRDYYVVKDVFRSLWFDSIWKQYTGYTLLGITAIAAIIGLRKRIKLFSKLGSYDGWRIVHLGVGLLAAVALAVHTGFRLGDNLNMLLMLSFLSVLVFGAVAGLITGSEHELRDQNLISAKSKPRSLPMWAHILGLWPLPVLLVIHILTVYTY